MFVIPWNLTRHVERKRNADVIVVAPSKAGRTWLRIMTNKYLSLVFNVPFSIDDLHKQQPSIPSIIYEDWLWYHLRIATLKQRLRGRYIIPMHVLATKKIVMLVRDPRDIIVSAYFQESKREHGHKSTDLSIAQYVHDRKRGIASVIKVLNLTHEKVTRCPQYMMLRYEDMKADATRELTRLLKFIGLSPDPRLVAEAVAFGDFNNMRKMELNDALNSAKLRPGDKTDPNSFKTRKGKVGGYVEYFSADDLAYLDQQVARLHRDFGYQPR